MRLGPVKGGDVAVGVAIVTELDDLASLVSEVAVLASGLGRRELAVERVCDGGREGDRGEVRVCEPNGAPEWTGGDGQGTRFFLKHTKETQSRIGVSVS